MRRLLLALLLLLISVPAYADSNAIKMGYTFGTVSQNVVFNSTMQTGGTLTLSASVADGGGRNPGDPFTMKLVFYNSSNAIVSTVQQSWTLVLGAAPATYSIAATNCGGSCANVAYVSVQFYGKDGGYWAGNYGPYIRDPVLSMNGGGNILYNPDFGIYNGNVYAQGWSSTTGWQSCQLYSGTNTCVINYNAAVNGGNYSASGGTTSGTAGGYTSAPPAPTYPAATISTAQQTAIDQTLTSHNLVYIDQSAGDHTYVYVTQTGDHNIMKATITGSYQSLTTTQTGNYNYEESIISGHNNTITNSQDGNKSLFQTVSGINNNITTIQTGGNHFLELNIPTDGNTVSVTQSGAAQKLFSLTINSPNVGVTIQQTNATTSDSASMSITCNSGPCTGYTYTKN